jgi:GxGYxY sequence motif in domain of unknown function N-terminal/GxGYxYP putative glycoside hydrolase C-terminal domain
VATAALALTSVAIPATATAATAQAAGHPVSSVTPELWPKLSPFSTLVTADLTGGTADEQLAATTLEGAYNQLQGATRLYVTWNADDQTWLNDNVLTGVQVSALPGQGSGPAGQLDAMLAGYGQDIKGAILINPSDPDTINLATTMAGIDDAMVADPSQAALLKKYGIPVIYSFAHRTFASATDAYQWAYTNLLPQTNSADLVMLNPADYGTLRDYIIATKSFVFYLTSTDAAEKPLMNKIIRTRPANTPILGYIADEGPDVADLSSLGHFLNASDFLDNGSDWAAVASAATLSQPHPHPVQAGNNTVYVSFLVSDGDNAQYDEHQMFDVWTAGTDLGAVPEGWTTAPGMADFAPSLLTWFYQHLPRDSELLPGPSGVGYATQMTGGSLQRFAKLSGGFMRQESMSTADYWEPPSEVAAYAQSSAVPSISVDAPLAYTQAGKTAVVGQTSGYIDSPSTLLSTIEQDVLSQPTSAPVFVDPLADGWAITPQDVLAIGQALATWGKTVGKTFVFTTPSELALTEETYQQGGGSSLPKLNAQAVSGAALLRLPPAGQLQGFTPPTPSGPNLVSNPSGQDGTTGWTDTTGTLSAGTYQGGPDLSWSVPTTEPDQQWVHTYPAVTDGDTYQFSVQVAGSGQVFLDTYNGAEDLQSPAIDLTSNYQTLTWTATIPSNAPGGQTGNAPQLQVREVGIGPVSVDISNATVQLASGDVSRARAGASLGHRAESHQESRSGRLSPGPSLLP